MAEDAAKERSSAGDVLQPNNFLSYIGAAIRLYRPAAGKLSASFGLLGIVLVLAFGASEAAVPSSQSATLLFFGLVGVLTLVGGLFSSRASSTMVQHLGGAPTPSEGPSQRLRDARSHLVAAGMVGAGVAVVLTLGFGLLGALVGMHLMLGPPVLSQSVAIEGRPFQEALARARELLRGQSLRVFLYLLCAALALSMFELMVIRLAVVAASALLNGNLAAIGSGVLIGGTLGLGLSFMAAVGLVTYFDVRSRNETFDVTDLREGGEGERP